MNAPGPNNQRGRRDQRRRRTPARPAAPADFWRAAPLPGPVEAITPASDPGALLRSLGTPPLLGHSTAAEHYLATVVERAAGLATALAASAGLLADPDAPDAPDRPAADADTDAGD